MADLSRIMDELGSAIDVIDGLRVHPYYADRVTPPSAIVAWPDEFMFDTTAQRNSDRVTMPVVVVVGRADARSSRDRLALYVSGDGPSSVKFAVESYPTMVWSSARVTKVEFGAVTIAAVQYLSATFDVDLLIPGKGT